MPFALLGELSTLAVGRFRDRVARRFAQQPG
jgi:hypothetical protein